MINAKGKENAMVKSKKIDYSAIDIIDIELNTLSGKQIKISDFKGEPVVLNFWHTRCVPCIKEMPQLNIIKSDYKGKVEFLAITKDDTKLVTDLLKEHLFEFTQVVNAEELTNSLQINRFPTMVYIDKNGKVINTGHGVAVRKDKDGNLAFDGDQHIRKEIDNLLKK
jgi:cytochrome c biogenesis protein CcmG/thiol:disulfide interchange protein DsbE